MKKQRPQNIHRVAFLALREEIIVAINDGWKIMQIWETLHNQGKISFSYPTFTVYVNKLIFHKDKKPLHSITDIPSQTSPLSSPKDTNLNNQDRPANKEVEKASEKPSTKPVQQASAVTQPANTNDSNVIKGFKYDPNIIDMSKIWFTVYILKNEDCYENSYVATR